MLCTLRRKVFESKPVPFTSAETGQAIQPKRYVIKGSVPTRYVVVPHSSPITSRKRRRVSKNTVRISWVFFHNNLIWFDCMYSNTKQYQSIRKNTTLYFNYPPWLASTCFSSHAHNTLGTQCVYNILPFL